MPYGHSRCEVRIDSADAFPNDDGYLFAVERSDPQHVLFVHATTDTRSPRYFGDALGSAAESAFVLQTVSVEQAVNLPLSKFGFVVLSNLFGLPGSLENSLLAYVKGGGERAARARHRFRSPRARADLRRGGADGARLLARIVGRHDQFLSVGDTDRSHASVGKTGSLSASEVLLCRRRRRRRRTRRRAADRPHAASARQEESAKVRVLLFASGLDNLTNDFPLHPAFVAFVEQTARYLSGAERPASARAVDSFFDLRTSREQEPGRSSAWRSSIRRPSSALLERGGDDAIAAPGTGGVLPGAPRERA